MKPSKETVKKLRKLQKYIIDEPRRFDMHFWGIAAKDLKSTCRAVKGDTCVMDQYGADIGYEARFDDAALKVLVNQKPPCGTVGCLAGNAAILAGSVKPIFANLYGEEEKTVDVYEFPDNTPTMAANWLGLDTDDANKLFYMDDWGYDKCWPEEYGELYRKAKTTAQRAKVACGRIDHFIETGE